MSGSIATVVVGDGSKVAFGLSRLVVGGDDGRGRRWWYCSGFLVSRF